MGDKVKANAKDYFYNGLWGYVSTEVADGSPLSCIFERN